MLTDLQVQAIQRLPRTTHVWQGDLRSLDSFASVRGVAGGLTGAFWVDESTAAPRAIHPYVVTHDNQRTDLILEGLIEALLSPMQGRPGKPRQILVCRREYQLYLRGVLQPFDIQVEYRPQLPLLDEISAFLAGNLGNPFGLELQAPDDLPEDQILTDWAGLSGLYDQAVGLWRRAPWQYLGENPPISLNINQWGIENLHATVLGGGDILSGVVFYFSRDDFDQLLTDASDDRTKLLRYDALYVHFLPTEDAPPPLIQQFERYEWPQPNKSTYTDIGRLVKGQGIRTLGRNEALIVQSALQALNTFLSKQGRRLREGDEKPVVFTTWVNHPQRATKFPVQVEYIPLPPQPLELVSWSGPIRDDLFPDGMSVVYQVLPWQMVSMLEVVASISRPAPKDIPIGTQGFPVVILALKARAAQKVCQRLLDENFLGILFTRQVLDGESVDFTLAATEQGGVYLILDVEEDVDYRDELVIFQQAQKLCQGGHGLIVVKQRKGTGFSPEDVVGIFQCNGPLPTPVQAHREPE